MAQESIITPWIVFYSWQSDLPNATNRGFIEKALENAAKSIRANSVLALGPIIDRDTKGVPGSPNIASTIFGKIDQAEVVLCDVSIINGDCLNHEPPARPTPNPNVLIELGYALKALDDRRVILVLNQAYGDLERLPFDLKTRRTVTYTMHRDALERHQERKQLEMKLTDALRAIAGELQAKPESAAAALSLPEQACAAIEQSLPTRVSLVQRYMKQFAGDIAALMPPFQDPQRSQSDDELVAAIDATQGMVAQFSRLAEAVAISSDEDAARAIYGGLTHLLDLYWTPRSFTTGPFYENAFDLAKFVGHEAFVSLFALLLQESRWNIIADLLDEDLYVNTKHGGRPGSVDMGYVSQYLRLLDGRKQRLGLRYYTLHGHLLNERHQREDLAEIVPMQRFAEGDYFLYLCGQIRPEQPPKSVVWRPWSTVYLKHVPRYLDAAIRVKGAQHLLRPLGVDDISTLRDRFTERVRTLGDIFGWPLFDDPLQRFDPATIGTKK